MTSPQAALYPAEGRKRTAHAAFSSRLKSGRAIALVAFAYHLLRDDL
jgi:hypothetical protein